MISCCIMKYVTMDTNILQLIEHSNSNNSKYNLVEILQVALTKKPSAPNASFLNSSLKPQACKPPSHQAPINSNSDQ